MFIEAVPNGDSPPAVLLRESYRQEGKVKKHTLANLSKWSPELVEGFRILLKKGTAVPKFESSFDIVRSQPHGHIAALLGSLRKIGFDRCLGPPGHKSDLVVALIVARLAHPRSNARHRPQPPSRHPDRFARPRPRPSRPRRKPPLRCHGLAAPTPERSQRKLRKGDCPLTCHVSF